MDLTRTRDEYVGLQLKLLVDGVERLRDEWSGGNLNHFQPGYVYEVREALRAAMRTIREAFQHDAGRGVSPWRA